MRLNSRTPSSFNGLFITFEGIDGCGKSTQAGLFFKHLLKKRVKTVLTREPGGTAISEKIRSIILDSANRRMKNRTELLLVLAARAQHVSELIAPALESGRTVLCDRFADATLAYQGGGRDMDAREIQDLNRYASGGLIPDLTFLFDLPVDAAYRRMGNIGKKSDRMEKGGRAFMERVRRAYLRLAEKEPRRIKVINAVAGAESVRDEVMRVFEKRFGGKHD